MFSEGLCYARRARRIALKATILARNEWHGENEWIDTPACDTSWNVDLLRVSAVRRHAVALLACRLAPLQPVLQSVAVCGVTLTAAAAAAVVTLLETGAMSAWRALTSFDLATWCTTRRAAADGSAADGAGGEATTAVHPHLSPPRGWTWLSVRPRCES